MTAIGVVHSQGVGAGRVGQVRMPPHGGHRHLIRVTPIARIHTRLVDEHMHVLLVQVGDIREGRAVGFIAIARVAVGVVCAYPVPVAFTDLGRLVHIVSDVGWQGDQIVPVNAKDAVSTLDHETQFVGDIVDPRELDLAARIGAYVKATGVLQWRIGPRRYLAIPYQAVDAPRMAAIVLPDDSVARNSGFFLPTRLQCDWKERAISTHVDKDIPVAIGTLILPSDQRVAVHWEALVTRAVKHQPLTLG